jgi:hypothetical protein
MVTEPPKLNIGLFMQADRDAIQTSPSHPDRRTAQKPEDSPSALLCGSIRFAIPNPRGVFKIQSAQGEGLGFDFNSEVKLSAEPDYK